MRIVTAVVALTAMVAQVRADEAVTLKSTFGLEETAQRFGAILQQNGAKILDRRPDTNDQGAVVEAFVFENPLVATFVGRCRWSDTHHRPLAAEVRRDAAGVWVTYHVPEERPNAFGVIECGKAKDEIQRLLDRMATAAAGL